MVCGWEGDERAMSGQPEVTRSQAGQQAVRGRGSSLTDSSSRTVRFFLYNMAVRMFIVDFFDFLPSHCRLSEIVAWRARPLVVRPPGATPSSSSSGSPLAPGCAPEPVGSE